MNIDTLRFGNIEIEDDKIITIIEGMLGFPDRFRYVILKHSDDSPFSWLQCVDDPSLAFVIMDPGLIQSNYAETVGKENFSSIGLDNPKEAVILVVANIARDYSVITANLEGPVIVNPKKMLGRQFVLCDSGYSTRHLIFSKEKQMCSEIG